MISSPQNASGASPAELAARALDAAKARGNATLACAESCTGGAVASALTDVPGASAVFCGGVVAYAVAVKRSALGVPAETLARFGVVSRECAEAMARGAARALGADFAVATTGVAGPGPQDGVPAGTVCIAVAAPDSTRSETVFFPGETRARVKSLATCAALRLLADVLLSRER
ncbi:MAG: CinA family protein [Candidatus Spyradosoma sp.]